jgi:hypothetical protein
LNYGKHLAKVIEMGRKAKSPEMLMDHTVRIPVTRDQKQLILEAVTDEPAGMAAWARAVLLDAARRKLEKKEKK